MADAPSQQPRDDARHFHIHTCLGSGGFGDVYRASMISAGGVRHEVAVKVLHDGLDPSSQAVRRLRDEGRMLGVLRHPAILRVHDLVVLAGRVALVTEFVDGGDLDQCFKAGDLDVRPLVEIIGHVAAALQAAWTHPSPDGDGSLHLVHRDVKPANIRVGKHGEVKLLDFGIAKAAGVRREARTQARALVGSYLYMAPERLMRRGDSGPESDIYSLGTVLYEGLAKRRLFAGVDLKDQLEQARDADAHDRYCREAVTALHAVDPRVRDLIASCLHHDPSRRPSAGDLAAQCEDLADALPGKNLRVWARKRDWPRVVDVLGELGGRTLTESTIITGTIPADMLATPAPEPRKPQTMVDFLDEVHAQMPTEQEIPIRQAVEGRQRITSATIVAPDGSEKPPALETVPPPLPQAIPVDKTAVRVPSVGRADVPKPRNKRAEAPTQQLHDAPERPAVAPRDDTPSGGRSWGLVLLTVGLLGVGALGVAGVSGVGVAMFLNTTQEAAPDADLPVPASVADDDAVVDAAADEAPEPAPAEAPVPTASATPTPASAPPAPGPAAAPAPAPAAAAAPVPEPEVREIAVAPSPDPAPAPAPTVVITRDEPAPAPGGGGDAWGDEPEPEPEPEPEAAPPPRPSGGQVSVDGRVPVQLRGRGQTHQPGLVPVGSWEIWADFGQGWTKATNSLLIVGDGGSYTIKCSSLRLQCSVGG